jgi:DNA invertase Pin-like site-specific DNA recombinase
MRIIAYEYCDPTLDSGAESRVWQEPVDQVYRDFAPQRSQFQQLLQACQGQPVQYLLLHQLIDLGDSIAEVSHRLAQLEALGIAVMTPEFRGSAEANLQGSSSWLQTLNTLQTQQHSRRIQRGYAHNRLKALPPPGKAPYGYQRGKDRYTLDRRTAPVVKDFFEHFLLYGSLRGAVRHLETKHAKKISVSTGHRWLTNPVYRGDLLYQDHQVVTNTHTSILSRQEAAQIDRLLRRNRRLTPRAASAPRSLSGLVICAACHSPMTVARVTTPRRRQEYLYLRPKTCPQSPHCGAIPYQKVLDCTIERICEDLPRAVAAACSPPSMRESTAPAPVPPGEGEVPKPTLEQQVKVKQGILQQLPDLIASQILDPETAELRAYKLQTEIATLQDQLAQLPPVNLQETAQAVSIPQFWEDLSETERRFYFREFIRRIEIARTEISWTLNLRFIF